jgi:hypothetical protein
MNACSHLPVLIKRAKIIVQNNRHCRVAFCDPETGNFLGHIYYTTKLDIKPGW